MKTAIAIVFSGLAILGCTKAPADQQVAQITAPAIATPPLKAASVSDPLVLSLDNLVGTWILLDSEGEPADSHDYMNIKNVAGDYNGILRYQGSTRSIKLKLDGKNYFAISSKGEKYKIYQVRSRFSKENNGIGIDLIIGDGVDDIELGSFQREDILKQLEGQ